MKNNSLLFSHITIKYLFLSNIINFFELSTKFWTIYIIFNQIYRNEIILKNFKNNKNLKTPMQKCWEKFSFSIGKITIKGYSLGII